MRGAALALALAASSAAAPAGWITIDAAREFTFLAPAGTEQYSDGGMAIDSFASTYRGPGFKLIFDYGLYSNDLSGKRSRPGYSTENVRIDGRDAIVVTGPAKDAWCTGTSTSVYLVVSPGRPGHATRFNMTACAETAAGVADLRTLFLSLRFSKP